MAITRTVMIDDDGSGTTGTIINNAWKQELYNQIDGTGGLGGFWTGVPFNAANFVSSAGTWAVTAANQAHLHWVQTGKTAFVNFRITGTMTLSVASTSLTINLPAPVPVTVIPNCVNPFTYYMTGAVGTGIAEIQANGKLVLTRDVAGTSWPTFTSAFFIGQLYYPV